MAEQSMRERAAIALCAKGVARGFLFDEEDCAAFVDAVLAEIETPTEGMVQAATEEYEEWCQDEDTFSVAKLAELMLAAAIRAAREGK